MIHRHLFALLLPLAAGGTAIAQRHVEAPTVTTATAFAIVVDDATWTAIPEPIRRYRTAVEADGLATFIVVDDWRTPEGVRDALRRLHSPTDGQPPLEGAILVGRIPIAMFRGAQHLTTAFKMDEDRYPLLRSSVPSDRFYEDFDLVAERLDGDAERPLLHYYRLAPESTQRIDNEIYTARLLPPGDDDAARHAAIARCLERFATAVRPAPPLHRVLTLMGHGYLSESLDAWAAGREAMAEAISALRRPGGSLTALHHELDRELEPTLLRELADPGYDLAILHSHGDDDRQYLTGAPPLPSATSQVEALRRHLRAQLRKARERGKPEAEVQRQLAERWHLSDEWFADAFDAETTRADEALEATKELEAKEVRGIACGAEVVELDSCFNGAFTAADYQAAAYLFGTGSTLAVVANSVNVGQDVWGDRNLGALALGERVGRWHQARPHLESHLFGDPTLRFAPGPDTGAAARQRGLRTAAPTATADPLMQSLAHDDAAIVRLEALAWLARRRDATLDAGLAIAAVDPSALVRRAAAELMGDVGDDGFLPQLLHAALRDPCERVAYTARSALAKYDAAAVAAAFARARAELPTPPSEDGELLLRRLQTAGFIADYRSEAANRSRELKKRIRAIRTFRLYRVHAVVPELIALARSGDEDAAVRQTAIEALGWFVYSRQREAITAAATEIAAGADTPAAVRAEAKKTIRRLRDGANDPLLP